MEPSYPHKPRWWESPRLAPVLLGLIVVLALRDLLARGHLGQDEVVAFVCGVLAGLPVAWYFSREMASRLDMWAEDHLRAKALGGLGYPPFTRWDRAAVLALVSALIVVAVVASGAETSAFFVGVAVGVAPLVRAQSRVWWRAWDLYRERRRDTGASTRGLPPRGGC